MFSLVLVNMHYAEHVTLLDMQEQFATQNPPHYIFLNLISIKFINLIIC